LGRAAYAVLLSRARPNYTDKQIQWKIPLAKGWALIHAARVLDGEPMIWPQIERSELGRQFLKIEARILAKRKELGLDKE